jgi:pimeloyl-ACP methyl ester carboxylesterase
MPRAQVGDIGINYETEGSGDPLVLIPYLSADHACYAFQLPDFTQAYTCVTLDLRGAGVSDKPDEPYSTEGYADDVAGLMDALGIERAHVGGVSLGAATAMWLAIKHPARVASLGIHSGWPRTDPFLRAVLEGWQVMARGLGSVPETVIGGIFPWCFTPEMYATKPEFVQGLSDFVRSRPEQPVDAFLRQADAVIGHDCQDSLADITAPTLITFGRWDLVTSTRFSDVFTSSIPQTEVVVFEHLSHAGLHEDAAAFNGTVMDFLARHPM